METPLWNPTAAERDDLGLVHEFGSLLGEEAPYEPVHQNPTPTEMPMPSYGPADLSKISGTRVTPGTRTDFLGWYADQQRQRAQWAQRHDAEA